MGLLAKITLLFLENIFIPFHLLKIVICNI